MNKSVFLSAALAAALGLSACSASSAPGPAGQAGPSAQSGQGASAQSTPEEATAPPSSPRESISPSAPSAAPVSPPPTSDTPSQAAPTATRAPDAPDALASFTFPDGHVSFSYPGNWTVRVEKTTPSANQPQGVEPVHAVLADQTGNELLAITSNSSGGGASGPVLRTVLDNAPVPGLKDTSGGQLDFGFAFDSFAGHPEFHMDIRPSREFEPSPESSGSALVPLANGLLETQVLFGTPAFRSVDAAKAWMGTPQYASLKRLLLSITYQ